MGGKAALCAALVLLCGCSSGPKALVVGSKNFTEQLILGEIIAQHLESSLHSKVERRLNLGGTLLAQQALIQGDIDLYPEYTGTALASVLKQSPNGPREEVLKKVRAGYAKWGIEWLNPLGFNDTFAMVVRSDQARSLQMNKLSDASKKQWTLGTGYEFANRPDGLPGLQKTYQIPLARAPLTMDLGLLYQALGKGQVDIVAGNSTDAQLASNEFTVLEDDRHYFPPYEACIAIRTASLSAEARKALESLSGRFTDARMRELNAEVTLKHRSVTDVAKEFLANSQH